MCGIAGFINQKKIYDNNHLLNAMLTRIWHRGPDECGLYLSDKASLGNVRLSIIDLASGQQPMFSADGRYVIVYNGEVFNYPELKEKLISKGYSFKTNCDTEVVLYMYQEFGAECLKQFNGQFAIAIWDKFENRLFLARDRVGIRPLYYSNVNGDIVFASEIKSIFEYPDIKRNINLKSLSQVFTYWTTLSPDTIFDNIFELPPAHYAIIKNGNIDIKPYWTLNFKKSDINKDEALEKLDFLLRDSLRLRMRADVQVAAYLSGGLDSTTTTAYVKEMFPETLNTFSLGFKDKIYDETVFQKQVSDFLNTKHHNTYYSNDDAKELISKVLWHTETPILRASPIPMFKLSKLVRDNNIKVVLTGEGADEILAGYNIFKEVKIRHFWAKEPTSKIRPLLLKKLYPYLPHIANSKPQMLKMFFGYKLTDVDSPIYSHLLRWHNTSRITNYFSDSVKNNLKGYDSLSYYSDSIKDITKDFSPLAKAQYIESKIFMSNYLLSTQGDRVGMGNSIENRFPFLDHRIVEFCSSLPDDFKLNGLNEKYLLKELAKDKIPFDIFKRPKQAYRAPISNTFLEEKNNELIISSLSKKAINKTGLFNYNHVNNLVNKISKSGEANEIENMAFIGILSTQLLHKIFIEDFKPLKKSEIKKGIIRCN